MAHRKWIFGITLLCFFALSAMQEPTTLVEAALIPIAKQKATEMVIQNKSVADVERELEFGVRLPMDLKEPFMKELGRQRYLMYGVAVRYLPELKTIYDIHLLSKFLDPLVMAQALDIEEDLVREYSSLSLEDQIEQMRKFSVGYDYGFSIKELEGRKLIPQDSIEEKAAAVSCFLIGLNLNSLVGLKQLFENRNVMNKPYSLYVGYNLISAIEQSAFPQPNLLKGLDFSNNIIELLKPNNFSTFTELEVLFLKSNQLEQLVNGVFNGLSKVLFLDLSKNRLQSIESSVFLPMNSLMKLDLSNNELTDIKQGTFAGLSNLQYLDLRGNDLSEQSKAIIHQELPRTTILFN